MAGQLPLDVWRHISDFLQTDSPSLICISVWEALRRRHVSCRVSPRTISQKVADLKSGAALHTLSITGPLDETGAQQLAALNDAPSLETLTVDLGECEDELADGVVKMLGPLRHSKSLTRVSLIFRTALCGASFGHRLKLTWYPKSQGRMQCAYVA